MPIQMVRPTRMPPAVASPLERPPRTMLRMVTRVSGPGQQDDQRRGHREGGEGEQHAQTLRPRGAMPWPLRFRPVSSSAGADRDAAFAGQGCEFGDQPALRADALEQPGEVVPVQAQMN